MRSHVPYVTKSTKKNKKSWVPHVFCVFMCFLFLFFFLPRVVFASSLLHLCVFCMFFFIFHLAEGLGRLFDCDTLPPVSA